MWNRHGSKKNPTVDEIKNNPEKYLERKIILDCDIRPLQASSISNLNFYVISDNTGRILGLSRGEYYGKGTVEGILKKTGSEIYIYF